MEEAIGMVRTLENPRAARLLVPLDEEAPGGRSPRCSARGGAPPAPLLCREWSSAEAAVDTQTRHPPEKPSSPTPAIRRSHRCCPHPPADNRWRPSSSRCFRSCSSFLSFAVAAAATISSAVGGLGCSCGDESIGSAPY
jgi:hypothetical protein